MAELQLSYIGSRLCCLAFGAVVGGNMVAHGWQQQSAGQVLSGIGMGLFGILWFLCPFIFGKTDKPLLATMLGAAIGPPRLRAALAAGAVACIATGTLLRYGFGV